MSADTVRIDVHDEGGHVDVISFVCSLCGERFCSMSSADDFDIRDIGGIREHAEAHECPVEGD